MAIIIGGKRISDMISQVSKAEGEGLTNAYMLTDLKSEMQNIDYGVSFNENVAAAVAPDMHTVGRML